MAQETFNTARIANIVLGVWLLISALLWPHSDAQMTNTLIVGVLCVAFALVAPRVPEVRYLNVVLAIWLLLSVWALPTASVATRWNNGLVAIAILAVSMVPGYLGGPRSRPLSRP